MEVTLFLGLLVGAILGLAGAGGGILAVPALVAGMGWSMQQAAPVALIAVAGSAALGAIDGLRKGLVRYRAALLMVVVGVPFTSVGLEIAQVLSQRWLLGLFAFVMLIVATRLFRHARASRIKKTEEHRVEVQVDPATGRIRWSWLTVMLIGSIGALTGFMTGLLGVGGGFVIVPMLRRYTNVSMHGIVATSLMVIALVGFGGVISAVVHGVHMPFETTTLFTLTTATGMLGARKLAVHISEHHVQLGFALVLVAVALGMMFKTLFYP